MNKYDEKIECANCGWEGIRGQLEDSETCPNCSCDGYICIMDEEYSTDDNKLYCPNCNSTNVVCATFGENTGCSCKKCNHTFFIED